MGPAEVRPSIALQPAHSTNTGEYFQQVSPFGESDLAQKRIQSQYNREDNDQRDQEYQDDQQGNAELRHRGRP